MQIGGFLVLAPRSSEVSRGAKWCIINQMKNWCEKIVEYGTYLLVFLTPTLYFGGNFFIPYVTSKTFFFYGLVEIIFAGWLYLNFINDKYRLSKKDLLFFLPLIVLTGWLTLSGIFGVRPEMSFWSSLMRGTGLITLYHCLALSFVLVSLIKHHGLIFLKSLLLWFLGGAFIVTLSVWFGDEGFNLPFEFLQKSKGGGLIGNSSLAATYLVFAFFFGLFLSFKKEVIYKQKLWISIILFTLILSPLFLNIYSLFVTQKIYISARGAFLGIGIGIIVFILGYLILSQRKLVRIIGFTGLVICITLFIFSWLNLTNPASIIHQKFVEGATSTRFIFWDIAKQGIAERPILGWGPENYSVVYQKYLKPEIFTSSGSTAEIWNDKAHNVFFEMGIAGGYPAIVLYIIFLCGLLYGVYRAFQLANITRVQAGILWGLIIGYVCQNLFVFDSLFSLLSLAILTSIIFGLNTDLDSQKELNPNKYKQKDSQSKYVLVSVLILLVLSLVVFVIMPYRKVIIISDVITMSLNNRPNHYKDLLNISPVGDDSEIGKIAEDAYLLYSKNIIQIKNNPKLLMYSKIDLEKLLEYLEIVAQKGLYDYRLYLNMARLYNIYVDLADKQADSILRDHILSIISHAKELSPNDPQIKIISK